MKKILLLMLSLTPYISTAQAVKLSSYFGDNMVLQRSNATQITGKANPNDVITITLSSDDANKIVEQTIKADNTGYFATILKLKDYGTGYTLKIGNQAFKNVAIGELWMVSGQSNMAWPLGQTNQNETVAEDNDMRLIFYQPTFEVARDSMSDEELNDINRLTPYARTDGWKIAQRAALNEFSAIGIFFAERLRKMMPNVPIGLIQTAMGGAPIETFVPQRYIENDSILKKALYGDWRENTEINQWCRDLGKSNLRAVKELADQRHYFAPSYLYDARIAPLKGTTIKGVVWYQGESNADNIPFHNNAFRALVASWREIFDAPKLPFYFVQLSSHDRDNWPAFRNSQRLLANEIDNCEMVVSHDYGHATDIHPRDKKPVAERLANLALLRDYKFKEITPYFPQPTQLDKDGQLHFTNTLGALKTSDNQEIRGLEISTDGKNFITPKVEIRGDKLLISSPRPRIIRYGWRPTTDANIVNSCGIPVSTFTLEIAPLK